ncbi:hypothetical protein PTSG_12051 [Salpingoeca rosetta]|uniref:Uncharacterized protein n=1 Tax=Salpingoeca rosetta (strain ATCC 50818 / BSB-021) TaxID=946362 RepID=F2U665_SALR5|nr:uncharacterized protein PTSG_12051 [Salpingoeca rosetta]EGD83006.1 hypothetical protein PTSG_12051 [Salpingoeca rosetta]|eukprot:XP_004995370.1 hypothetical protein PTSG_12051 [Salpingoeca rosetta]
MLRKFDTASEAENHTEQAHPASTTTHVSTKDTATTPRLQEQRAAAEADLTKNTNQPQQGVWRQRSTILDEAATTTTTDSILPASNSSNATTSVQATVSSTSTCSSSSTASSSATSKVGDKPRKPRFLARVKQGMSRFVSFRSGSDDDSSSSSGLSSSTTKTKGGKTKAREIRVIPGSPMLKYDWSKRRSTNAHLTREEQTRQETRLKSQTPYMAKMAHRYQNVFECYSRYVTDDESDVASLRRHTCPPASSRRPEAADLHDTAKRVRERFRFRSQTDAGVVVAPPSRRSASTSAANPSHGSDIRTSATSVLKLSPSNKAPAGPAAGDDADDEGEGEGEGDDVFDGDSTPRSTPVPPPTQSTPAVATPPVAVSPTPRAEAPTTAGGGRWSVCDPSSGAAERHAQAEGQASDKGAPGNRQRPVSAFMPGRRPSYHPWPEDWDPTICKDAMGRRGYSNVAPPSITRK